MTNIICADCQLKFPNSETLEQHLLSNHATPGEPIGESAPPPAINAKDFEQTMQLIEADKAKKQAELDKIRAKHKDYVSPPAEKKPLRLEYKFFGNCSCGAEVETLEVDVGSNHFVSAFCLAERKQIRTDEAPLLLNPRTELVSENAEISEDGTIHKKAKKAAQDVSVGGGAGFAGTGGEGGNGAK